MQRLVLDMASLSIAHWNDAYRVTPQKIRGNGTETIDVTQFSFLLDTIRGRWPKRSDGSPNGLSLFSGDLFSPSVESTVTRGSHMVRVKVPEVNQLSMLHPGPCYESAGPRCCSHWFAFHASCDPLDDLIWFGAGNHDFDFGLIRPSSSSPTANIHQAIHICQSWFKTVNSWVLFSLRAESLPIRLALDIEQYHRRGHAMCTRASTSISGSRTGRCADWNHWTRGRVRSNSILAFTDELDLNLIGIG